MSQYQVTRRYTLQANNLYRMQVWVSEMTENMPCKIFAWQSLEPFPGDPKSPEIFVHVCSYFDLIAIPEDTPLQEEPIRLYRKYFFDIESRDKALLERTWRKVKTQVLHLVQDLVRLNTQEPVEVGFVEV